MEPKSHWEMVYGTKAAEDVSWYAPHLRESLHYIKCTGLPRTASLIDVGGGESTLVDDLLDAGHRRVKVLDISSKALQVCQDRLGPRGKKVQWLVADVLEHRFEQHSVEIWHDRAVFHFLTDEAQRESYVSQVLHALRPGGFAIVGTFGPQGPTQCSGLSVSRYAPDELHGQFGQRFTLVDSRIGLHTTPWGTQQQFAYCFCRLEH